MITLRELAIVDLSYRVAHKVSDKKLVHYVFRTFLPASMQKGRSIQDIAKEILAKRLGEEVKIETAQLTMDGGGMQVESLMDKVTPYTKNMLKNKIYNTVHEYNIPVYPLDMSTFKGRMKDRALRFLISMYWKLAHAHIVRGDIIGIRIKRHFGLLPKGFTEKLYAFCEDWTEKLYARRFSPITFFGVKCRESEIDQAVAKLEHQLWYFQESILGALSPIIRIDLADLVGDGEKRCVVLVYPAMKSDTARLLSDLMSSKDHQKFLTEFSFADEGGHNMKWVTQETQYEIETVEISLDPLGNEYVPAQLQEVIKKFEESQNGNS